MNIDYKTSKDYTRLKELMLAGKHIVGFVTYNWNHDKDHPIMATDAVGAYAFNVGCESECLHVGCRGTSFIDYYTKKEWCTNDHTFEGECKRCDLEYIDPTEPSTTHD